MPSELEGPGAGQLIDWDRRWPRWICREEGVDVTPDAVVYLVRHGRTALNSAGVLRGWLDPPLDEVGELEAVGLGEVFRGVALAGAVSSPLLRARRTALVIAGTVGLAVEVDAGLADRDYGWWAGTAWRDVERRFGSLDAAHGVEGLVPFAARVIAVVAAAAGRWGPAPVMVVAHDAVNRVVLAGLVPAVGEADGVSQRTGCWNRLECRDERWSAPIVDAVPDDGQRP